MLDWSGFILGFLFFFISHSIPTRPGVKARLVRLLGEKGFTLAYSALSIAALAILILAARSAPHVTLWYWDTWQNHLALSLMAIALVIVTLAIGRPNPLSFGGANNRTFSPDDPGIVGWFHHPLLAALLLWSSAHMIANGDLAHVIMFGCFAAFSVLGRLIINRRKKRELGAEKWAYLSTTRANFHPSLNGVIRALLGLAIYAAVIWAHEPVIGISPLP